MILATVVGERGVWQARGPQRVQSFLGTEVLRGGSLGRFGFVYLQSQHTVKWHLESKS